jgi:cell division protease FtsH
MQSTVKAIIFWFVIVLSAFLLWQTVRSGSSSTNAREISYSTFLSDVESGKVAAVTLSRNRVDGTYQDGSRFRATVPMSQEMMLQTLRQNKVEIFVRDEPSGDKATRLLNFAPLVLPAALWFYMIRQMKQQQVRTQAGNPIEPR